VIELLERIKEISPHAEPILVISLTAILGLLLGSIRILGMKLGVAGMLFSGLLLGHFGFKLDPHLMAFLKEFGLVLFVFTVGLQLGPGFFNSMKNDGLKLNSLAVMIVLSGALIVFGAGHFMNWDLGVTAGIFSGSTTNTPSLGERRGNGVCRRLPVRSVGNHPRDGDPAFCIPDQSEERTGGSPTENGRGSQRCAARDVRRGECQSRRRGDQGHPRSR
jgi:AspT/YidE/YbjL antiporter-like protein